MSSQAGPWVTGVPGAGAGAGADGAGLPGFTRWERAGLGMAAVVIAAWGVMGVDIRAAREPSAASRRGGDAVAATQAGPEREQDAAEAAGGAGRGRQLFEENGCGACHLLDGTQGVGPSLRGIWGTRQPLEDGTSVIVDRDYFRQSVLHPEARLVRGYRPAMPSYEGLLTDEDLAALEEYVSGLE